jgi:hypothetical protein
MADFIVIIDGTFNTNALRKAQERRDAKGVNTPCVAGPSHLDSPQAAPPESPPPSPGVLGLPVSTAPARLQEEEALGKRKRTVT